MHFSTFILRNLTRRPMRTLLTILGIAISIAAMVSLKSVANGFRQATEDAFVRRNVDLVVMAAGVPDQLNSDLDEAMGEQILKIPGVKNVSAGMVELSEIQRGNSNISVLVQGWPSDQFHFPELKLLDGRWLKLEDKKKVMIGKSLAENLKKHAGDTIKVMGELYTVVGVYQSFVVFENGAIVMPLLELQNLSGRKGRVTGFSVVCASPENGADAAPIIDSVKKAIEELTPSGRGRAGLSALPTREYLDNALYLRMTNAIAWMISIIAILIGTVGMLNTMIMSVMERVREIGILRAVGWSQNRIIKMIIGESILLSFTGAIVGVILAEIGIASLASLPMVSGFIEGKLSGIVILQGAGLTLVMGFLGGAYPAYRAAKLDPTEALRHD